MIAPGSIPSCRQWGAGIFSFGNRDVDGFALPLRAIVSKGGDLVIYIVSTGFEGGNDRPSLPAAIIDSSGQAELGKPSSMASEAARLLKMEGME